MTDISESMETLLEIVEAYNDPNLNLDQVYLKVRNILTDAGWEIQY